MRVRVALPLMFLFVAACKAAPSFDERYDAQSAKMNETIGTIEADLAQQINSSEAAGGRRHPNITRSTANEASQP